MDFNKLAENYGSLIAFLLVMGPSAIVGMRWVAKNVVEPLTKRYIQYIDRTAVVQEANSDILKEVVRTQAVLVDLVRADGGKIDTTLALVAKNQQSVVATEAALADLAKTKFQMIEQNKHSLDNLQRDHAKHYESTQDIHEKVTAIHNKMLPGVS